MRWAPLLLLVSACEAGAVTGKPPVRDDEGQARVARTVYIPAREGSPPSKVDFVPGYGRLPIYLNAAGGTYRAGADDAESGHSSILAARGISQVAMPAWKAEGAVWEELVGCVRGQLGEFAVDVVDVRPAGGTYMEVVFGGDGGELRLASYASAAPIDATGCRLINRAVVFVFAEGGSSRGACEAAVAGIGHAASLDHVMSCGDTMSFLGGCGERALTDEAHACGETAERPCICGRGEQNSMETMREQLGRKDGEVENGEPCETLTFEGTCEGDDLRWCDEDGRKRKLDCGDAGLTCGASNQTALGNDCRPDDKVEDDCQGYDFLGECSADGVLRYCLNGQLQEVDCAASGLECRFLDEFIGNLCTPPEEAPVDNCGDIDFFGECSEDGTQLRYCDNGELRLVNCVDLDQVCRFQSDDIGFNCLPPDEEPPPVELPENPDAGVP